MLRKTLVVVFALTALTLMAPAAQAQCVSTTDGTGIASFTLFAGQTIDAGTVTATVNGSNLEVTFSTTDGWTLNEAHLWVGSSTSDMPQTRKGNPIPGRFPYASGDISGSTSYTATVSLEALGFRCPAADDTYYIAAHAAVQRDNGDGTIQTETGWSDGTPITSRGSWATMSSLVLTCSCDSTPPVDPGDCETAFSYYEPANTCFLDIDEDGDFDPDFKRWGWTNGELGSGNYTMDIYAGAGQCDLDKGTNVGTLTVEYNGSSATVTYDLDSPYTLEETHLYVGTGMLAENNGYYTVAPGQYPTTHEDLDGAVSDSYTVNASGDIYVVAHAVVCGF